MRIRFRVDPSPAETAHYDQTMAAIGAWWDAFRLRAEDLDAIFSGRASWDVVSWVNSHLEPIADGLMWEFGPGTGGHRMVITPEANSALRPLVAELIRRATQIAGWEFRAHRIAENAERAEQLVAALGGESLDQVSFDLSVSEENLVDIECFVPKGCSDDAASTTAYTGVRALVGEATFERWIGALSISKATKRRRGAIVPGELGAAVGQAIREIRASLPAQRWVDHNDNGAAVLQREPPDEEDDYPARTDVFLGSSMYPQLAVASLSTLEGFVASERFSRHDEVFAYVKIDGSDGLPEHGSFGDRSDIEDAIDSILRDNGLGACVGGATGLRYAYVDFATSDIDRAIELLRAPLQDGGLPHRSWILFYDPDLAAEWIGIHPDTPPPPLPLP